MEIMMAGPMVRRLLDGTKTQTRRTGARWLKVKPGDVLHVREAVYANTEGPMYKQGPLYKADGYNIGAQKWTPAVHMPLHLCRMRLLVKRVWQERADEISEADAIAEGMEGVTIDDLLEMAGGSRRKILTVWQRLYKSAPVWAYLINQIWPTTSPIMRFRLVLAVLNAKPDDMVTAIEFEVQHVNR